MPPNPPTAPRASGVRVVRTSSAIRRFASSAVSSRTPTAA